MIKRTPISSSSYGAGGNLVTKSRLTLCDPMDCSPPGSSVHRISQARIILEQVAISFSRDLPNTGIEPVYLALAGGFFTTEPPGKPFLPLMRTIISSKRLYPHDFS